MELIVRVVLAEADLLCLIMVKMSRIKSHVLCILFVPVNRLQVGWVAQRILLELLAVDSVEHLGLLLGATEHGWEFLAVVTEVILHSIHILLKLQRLDRGCEVYLGLEKFVRGYFVLLLEV